MLRSALVLRAARAGELFAYVGELPWSVDKRLPGKEPRLRPAADRRAFLLGMEAAGASIPFMLKEH